MRRRLVHAITTCAFALTGCGSAEEAAPVARLASTSESSGIRPDPAPKTIPNPFVEDSRADERSDTRPESASTDVAVDSTPVASTPTYARSTTSASGSCGDGKRVCRDMDSCDDAVFHLQQCGMSRLDGDSDGTPCESICGN